MATIIGLVAAALFMLAGPSPDDIKDAAAVHLACAGIIGGALALILSLSIIPAQRAAEAFSAAILKLYARDTTLLLAFALLFISATASVLLGSGWAIGLSVTHALAVQFVILGLSFDALRFFYRKTLDLLIPATAVGLVQRECTRSIRKVRRIVDRLVHIMQSGRGSGDSQPIAQSITTAMLYAHSQLALALRAWIAQLDEFAHKGIARADTQAVNGIVSAMQTIGVQYADARRTSLVLLPDWNNLFGGGTSDISKVLDPINESIRVVCEHAAKEANELVVTHCIRTLGALTEHAMTVIHESSPGPYRRAPLAYSPCFYLDVCFQIALRAGMADAILAAIGSLEAILFKANKDVDTSTTETQAIQSLCGIATAGLIKPELVSAYPAVSALLRAARHDIEIRGYRRQPVLETVLTNLARLTPFEIAADRDGKRIMMQTFPPYSMTFEANIPALLDFVRHRVKPVDPERKWENPFDEFLHASETILHHYYDLAKLEFHNTLLLRWVVDSLIYCAKVHLQLLDEPPVGGERFANTVDKRLRQFIRAPEYFFHPQDPFPSDHANSACGSLAILGMNLLKRNRLDSAKSCGDAIRSICESCMASPKMPYACANLLEHIEILARAADALGHQQIANYYRALISKPSNVSDPDWDQHMQEFGTRVRQLDRELEEFQHEFALSDEPIAVLRKILENPSAS